MPDFHLNSDLTGLNSAIISAGCIFGGPMVGPIVDRWGRKAGLLVASICIIFGVILQASAASGTWWIVSMSSPGYALTHPSPAVQLIIGRFIIGFATLINGSVAPMWVMELASPKYRSILSSSTVVSVPFASFLVACIILGVFDKKSDWAWRGVMLVSIFDTHLKHPTLTKSEKGEAVPSILSICLLPLVDESPRWLFAKGRREEVTPSCFL